MSPCFEASFAIDGQSALRLYDCLVPKVKELSLYCDRCKKLRDEKGLHDTPFNEAQQDLLY